MRNAVTRYTIDLLRARLSHDTHKTLQTDRNRRGVILVIAALMMTVLVGMVAFAVDYGYILKVRTDLQRSADASALAAVQDLIRQARWNARFEQGPRDSARPMHATIWTTHRFRLRRRISKSAAIIPHRFIPMSRY